MSGSISSVTPSSDYAKAWLFGISRGVASQLFLYPLEAIKTNQQISSTPVRSSQIVSYLWQKDQWRGFYNGVGPHLAKTILRQGWWWPTIVHFPPLLKEKGFSTFNQQALTGVAVATIDAIVTSPLEKWRVLSTVQKNNSIPVSFSLKTGWNGALPYWRQQSVSWATMLVGQKYLRKTIEPKFPIDQKTHFLHLLGISFRMSLLAAVIMIPFNTANTIKQATGRSLFQELTNNNLSIFYRIRQIYRGLPINFIMLNLQLSSTIILIDYLESKKENKHGQ